MFRRTKGRLVDKIPHQIGNLRIALHERGHELLLRLYRFWIEIRICAAPGLWQKGKESEDDGNVVLVRRQQKRVKRSERRFVHTGRGIGHELSPAGPDSGANHVYAGRFHLTKVLIPNERVRLEQKSTMSVGGHVSRAGNRIDLVIAIEEMPIGC